MPSVSQCDHAAAALPPSSWHTHAYTEQRRERATQVASTITVVHALAGQWVFEFHSVSRPTTTTPRVHTLKLKVARRRLTREEGDKEQHRRSSESLMVRQAAERAREARQVRESRAHSAISTVKRAARASCQSSTQERTKPPPPTADKASPQQLQPGELRRSTKRPLPPVAVIVRLPSPAAKKRRSEANPPPVDQPSAPAPVAIYIPEPFIPTARSELVEEF